MGILQQATPKPAPKGAPNGATQAARDGDLSPASMLGKMKLSPQQQQQLARIVEAGKRVMFDEKTHHLMLESMDVQGPIEQKIGGGVVSLLGMLWYESKQSIPPELIIPAGVVLVAEACDFLNKSGDQVTPEQQGAATEFMIDTIFKGAGVDSNNLEGAMQQGQPAQNPAQMPPTSAPIPAQPKGVLA